MKRSFPNTLSAIIVLTVVIGIFAFARSRLLTNQNNDSDATSQIGGSISIAEGFDSIQENREPATGFP